MVLGGCAHYRPVHPEAREAGGVRGEIVAIRGDFLSVFTIRLTPATTVPVGQFRLASAAAAPCAAGDAMKILMAGAPEGLTLVNEAEVTLEASGAALPTRLAARDAVIDVQVGDAAASCLRLPVSGESNEPRWVSERRWSFGMSGALAWNYALSRDVPLLAALTLQRRVGAVRLGGRADFGGVSEQSAAAIGPTASVRARLGERWVVDHTLGYELGGVEHVGFAHGPRASLALLRTRPRAPGFSPEPFFGEGLEIFGGYRFASDRPSGAVPWYVGAGFTFEIGP
jgi:hypothetical protein